MYDRTYHPFPPLCSVIYCALRSLDLADKITQYRQRLPNLLKAHWILTAGIARFGEKLFTKKTPTNSPGFFKDDSSFLQDLLHFIPGFVMQVGGLKVVGLAGPYPGPLLKELVIPPPSEISFKSYQGGHQAWRGLGTSRTSPGDAENRGARTNRTVLKTRGKQTYRCQIVGHPRWAEMHVQTAGQLLFFGGQPLLLRDSLGTLNPIDWVPSLGDLPPNRSALRDPNLP